MNPSSNFLAKGQEELLKAVSNGTEYFIFPLL
jgi:hypothetical protein